MRLNVSTVEKVEVPAAAARHGANVRLGNARPPEAILMTSARCAARA